MSIEYGFIERDSGLDDEGLIAVEKIEFGSPVVSIENRQVRKATATDNEITGFATIPRSRNNYCIGKDYRNAYTQGDVVNVLKSRGVICVKHDDSAELKQNEALYFKAGKLVKEASGRVIGRVEKILSKEDKAILMWVE